MPNIPANLQLKQQSEYFHVEKFRTHSRDSEHFEKYRILLKNNINNNIINNNYYYLYIIIIESILLNGAEAWTISKANAKKY